MDRILSMLQLPKAERRALVRMTQPKPRPPKPQAIPRAPAIQKGSVETVRHSPKRPRQSPAGTPAGSAAAGSAAAGNGAAGSGVAGSGTASSGPAGYAAESGAAAAADLPACGDEMVSLQLPLEFGDFLLLE